MKALKNILNLTENHRNPANDPWVARDALQQEITDMSEKVDLFFGSAMDVADERTHQEVAELINQLGATVSTFSHKLEDRVQKLDRKIHKMLMDRRFT